MFYNNHIIKTLSNTILLMALICMIFTDVQASLKSPRHKSQDCLKDSQKSARPKKPKGR